MLRPVDVALCQMAVQDGDVATNLARVADMVENSGEAELVVFPELTLNGQVGPRDRVGGSLYARSAEPLTGGLVGELERLATRYGPKWLVVGMVEADPVVPGTIYNTAIVVGPEGLLSHQRKIHIPGMEKLHFAGGSNMTAVRTPFGTLGIAICYDAYFPEMVRDLTLQGATILVFPFNAPESASAVEALPHLVAARALENRCYALAANRVGSSPSGTVYIGQSCAAAPTGALLDVAPQSAECIVNVRLDPSLVAQERAWQPALRDRRPHLYRRLVSE